jgi:D-serine dehydratase
VEVDMNRSDPLIDPRAKGLPRLADDIRLSDIGRQGWSLFRGDLPLPLAVRREEALINNGRWMRAFVAATGARLAPHGKTTMSPQLFTRQLADGAWGLTLATVQQMRVARQAGVGRILLANQLIGEAEIAEVLDTLRADPEFEVWVLVDSEEGVRRLAAAAEDRPAGRPLNLLIEIGHEGGRAGCRDLATALAVARAVRAARPHLALAGVEGFEGLHQHLPGSEGAPKVIAFLRTIVAAAEAIDAEGLFDAERVILSAGGSAYYDLVAQAFAAARLDRPTSIVLRSGCYLTHDAGLYERLHDDMRARSATARAISGRFENALEVWAHVLSVPEPRRAILGAGRRDFGHDAALPRPIKHLRPGRDVGPLAAPIDWDIVAVNDQHAHMTFPAGADLKIGDMIGLGVSHPCSTFDMWRLIFVVDDAYVVRSAIETFF